MSLDSCLIIKNNNWLARAWLCKPSYCILHKKASTHHSVFKTRVFSPQLPFSLLHFFPIWLHFALEAVKSQRLPKADLAQAGSWDLCFLRLQVCCNSLLCKQGTSTDITQLCADIKPRNTTTHILCEKSLFSPVLCKLNSCNHRWPSRLRGTCAQECGQQTPGIVLALMRNLL